MSARCFQSPHSVIRRGEWAVSLFGKTPLCHLMVQFYSSYMGANERIMGPLGGGFLRKWLKKGW